jgi:hypothetical protein
MVGVDYFGMVHELEHTVVRLLKVLMNSGHRKAVLVKILSETTEAGDGGPPFISVHHNSLRSRGVSGDEKNLNAWKKTPISLDQLEFRVLEETSNVVARKIGVRVTRGVQLFRLNELRAMIEEVEKSRMVEMQVRENNGIYIWDSEPESAQVLLKRFYIFHRREGARGIVFRIAPCVHEHITIRTPEQESAVEDADEFGTVPQIGIVG